MTTFDEVQFTEGPFEGARVALDESERRMLATCAGNRST